MAEPGSTTRTDRPDAAGVPSAVTGFFAEVPLGVEVYRRCVRALTPWPDVETRVARSQVGLRRERGFAWLWLPGRYLPHAAAPVVLSVALGREDASSRWKQVAHPSTRHWIHHLEVGEPGDVDDEVGAWLQEAAARAGEERPATRR